MSSSPHDHVVLATHTSAPFSSTARADLPGAQRLAPVTVATIGHPDGGLVNTPPTREVAQQIEVRLNNALIGKPRSEQGWIVFRDLKPELFAVGNNLVGLRFTGTRPLTSAPLLIEKLEVQVDYRPVPDGP